MKNIDVRRITGVAILLAITLVLQVIANFIPTLFNGINLSLIPVAVGSIVYGPLAGLLLGTFGTLPIFFSTSAAFYIGIRPFWSIVMLLLKGAIPGLVAGYIYKLLSKKNTVVAAIVAALSIPVLNTGIFVVFNLTLLKPVVEAYQVGNDAFLGMSITEIVLVAFVGVNFFIEFGLTVLLSPTIVKIVKIMTRSDKHAL